jgi:hypothetical protein
VPAPAPVPAPSLAPVDVSVRVLVSIVGSADPGLVPAYKVAPEPVCVPEWKQEGIESLQGWMLKLTKGGQRKWKRE